MTVVQCPHCCFPLIMPSDRVGAQFTCLRCETTYDTGRASAAALEIQMPEAPPEPEAHSCPATRLTRPHICSRHNCNGQQTATGQRVTTVRCKACEQPTSIYAVLFRCEECDALLESPRCRIGKQEHCPDCAEFLTVPGEDLFNDEREQPDHDWYSFECIHCRTRQCSHRRNAGKQEVCPECYRVFEVPPSGQPVLPPPSLPGDGLGSSPPSVSRHCPKCGSSMPKQAIVCRACGRQS